MQIDCPNCRRVLDFAGERPSFCAYCGVPIAPSEGCTEVQPAARAPRPGRHRPGADRSVPRSFSTRRSITRPGRRAPADRPWSAFPERIAGYRLIRKLGSGGMGTVFEAEDEAHSRRVAIKLISSELLASGEAVERFRQEGRLASAVTHPRCVFVLAVDEHRGHPYIVMELMPGTTLQTLVEKQGPLEPADAIVKIIDVIEGLREFHKLGLIHRDVKPSNCFLEKEGTGQDRRLRPLQVARRRPGPDADRHVHRHAALRLSRADQAGRGGRADRRLFGGGDALLPAHRASAGAGQGRGRGPGADRLGAGTAAPRLRPEISPRARGRHPPRARARPGPAMAEPPGVPRRPPPLRPGRLSIAGIGRRVGAFVMDVGLAYFVTWAIFGLVMLLHRTRFMEAFRFYEEYGSYIGWVERILWITYFALLEGVARRIAGQVAGGPARESGRSRRAAGTAPRHRSGPSSSMALLELPADLVEQLRRAGRGAADDRQVLGLRPADPGPGVPRPGRDHASEIGLSRSP